MSGEKKVFDFISQFNAFKAQLDQNPKECTRIAATEGKASFFETIDTEHNKVIDLDVLNAKDLQLAYAGLATLLDRTDIKNTLIANGRIYLGKKQYPILPRTIEITTLPNGELIAVLIPKSKKPGSTTEKVTKPGIHRMRGVFKTGSDSVALFPREFGKPAEKPFVLVQQVNDRMPENEIL